MPKKTSLTLPEQLKLIHDVLTARPGQKAAMAAWRYLIERGHLTEGQVHHLSPLTKKPSEGIRPAPGCPGEPFCDNCTEEIVYVRHPITCPECQENVPVESLNYHLMAACKPHSRGCNCYTCLSGKATTCPTWRP